jgi:ABC-2 type transport system ATP-binding protein
LKQKQKTVFVSSHIIDPLLTTCDKIHLLENGCFVKTYLKTDFSKIEEDLFGKLKTEASQVISKAV